MNAKRMYIALSIFGFVLPYYFFLRFVAEHGLRLSILLHQVIDSPGAAFFTADLLISSLVLWVFIGYEKRKRPIKYWWVCIIANLAVGVSLALPLFLLLREIQLKKEIATEGGY